MFQNSALPSVSVDITRNIAGSLPRFRTWQGLTRLSSLIPLPRTFREYLAWLLILVGMTALALIQVWATLQIRQTELEVQTLRNQYVLIEQENAQLLWEISQYTTLERVEVEARVAGFVPALNRRYVPGESVSTGGSTFLINTPTKMSDTDASTWSVDWKADATQMGEQFAGVWDTWTTGLASSWEQIRQSTSRLGNMAQEQWARIDLSRLIWTRTSAE